jgi:flagellar L-ring protein precursor FlgH
VVQRITTKAVKCLFVWAVFFCFFGCVNHIKPYKQKRRDYKLPVAHAAYDAANSSGSLFDPRGVGSRLVTDARAQSVNDVVVVVIDEQATANRNASTSSSKQDERTAQLTSFLGLIAKLQKQYPDFDGATAMGLTSESSFSGTGQTSRSDRFEATVPSMVRQILPNGTLFIEGHRVVLVNEEEHHFYISGVIRPEDIDGLGQVQSSRIADAQIEFTGRGTLSAANSKGWLSSMLDVLWPF